jgi:hypothetical protein
MIGKAKKRTTKRVSPKNKAAIANAADPQYETPTPELLASGGVVKLPSKAHFNTLTCPCTTYLAKSQITTRQHDAARRMYETYCASLILKGLKSSSYEGMPSSGGTYSGINVTERMMIARREYDAAVRAIHGDSGKAVIKAVVCDEMSVSFVTTLHLPHLKEYKTPAQLMARFKDALTDLANHYGLKKD